ncbi:MAG: hypothetical protein J3Q66DRAFT_330546, partial [Benniella sp.]
MYSTIRSVLDRLQKNGDLKPTRQELAPKDRGRKPNDSSVLKTSVKEIHDSMNSTVALCANGTVGSSFTTDPNAVISPSAVPGMNTPFEDRSAMMNASKTVYKSAHTQKQTTLSTPCTTRTSRTTTLPDLALRDQENIVDTLAKIVELYYDGLELSIATGQRPFHTGSTVLMETNGYRPRPVYDSLMQQHLHLTDHLFEQSRAGSKNNIDAESLLDRSTASSSVGQACRESNVIYKDGSHVDWNWVSKELQYQLHFHQHSDVVGVKRDNCYGVQAACHAVVAGHGDIDTEEKMIYTSARCQSLWRLLHSANLDIRASYDPLFDQPYHYKRRLMSIGAPRPEKLHDSATDDRTIQPPGLLKRFRQEIDSLSFEQLGRPWDSEEIEVLENAMEARRARYTMERHGEAMVGDKGRTMLNTTNVKLQAKHGQVGRMANKVQRTQQDERQQRSIREVDWSEIQRQHFPWRREAEISLQWYLLQKKKN